MTQTPSKLTASVVGGGFGGQLSLTALRQSNRFELVAAADLQAAVCRDLEIKFPGLQTFTTHQDLFAKCPTNVVCVSTFPPSHETVVMDALELPLCGILVEKPLGHTFASGQRLLNAIQARRLPMATPHNLLAKDASLEILMRVWNDEIGDLRLLEVQCQHWDIINAGIHWFHFFVRLTRHDPPSWVMAVCDSSSRTFRDGMQVETIAVSYVQTLGGVRAVMNTGDHVMVNPEAAGFETLFRIVGTKGQIEYPAWSDTYRLQNATHPHGKHFTVPDAPVSGHQRHLEHLADQIAAGIPDYTIPESSLLALELCEGAYLSSQHRCQVRFPLTGFVAPSPTDWQPGQPYQGLGGGQDGRKR
jgi:predicted dehydrogenase